MYIRELTNSEFENFTKVFPMKSIFQTKEYAFVMNHQGYNSEFLGLIDNNKIIAASLILIQKHHGYSYAYAPRGFLIDYNNIELYHMFNDELKKYLGKKNIAAVKLSPLIIKNGYDNDKKLFYSNNNYENIYNNLRQINYHHYGYNNFFEAQRPRFEALIDLSKSEKELFNNITKSYRTKIKSAYKNGIYITEGSNEDIAILYNQVKNKYPRNLKYLNDMYEIFNMSDKAELFLAKLDTKKYLLNAQNKYENINNLSENINYKLSEQTNNFKIISNKINTDMMLDKAKIKLINATKLLEQYPDGINLASILVVKNDTEVYMVIDGYDSNFKDLNAKHLLIWELIKKYSKEGCKVFNLGGVSNINLENNKYKGLVEFKNGFGAYVAEYMGDLEVITNEKLYFVHKKMEPIKKLIKK